jgi:hypothetical protein
MKKIVLLVLSLCVTCSISFADEGKGKVSAGSTLIRTSKVAVSYDIGPKEISVRIRGSVDLGGKTAEEWPVKLGVGIDLLKFAFRSIVVRSGPIISQKLETNWNDYKITYGASIEKGATFVALEADLRTGRLTYSLGVKF